MDVSLIKGLIGIACFLQSSPDDQKGAILSNLTQEQIAVVSQLENPCQITPDLDKLIFREDEDNQLVLISNGQPSVTASE